MKEQPTRKPNRLSEYDYSTPGSYFITICTYQKKKLLSDITVGEGLAPPAVRYSEIGKIAEQQLLLLPERFPQLTLAHYVIMPNHIHILFTLRKDENAGGASPSPTVIDAVRCFKSLTTRLARPFCGEDALFQRSFHDHVIRNDADYREIWNYIDTNPARWSTDCFYE